MSNKFILHAEYRENGYEKSDFDYLKKQLKDILEFKPKAIWMPDAGGFSEIWFLLEFIGISATSGVIGSIAWNALTKSSTSISNFVQNIRKKHKNVDSDVFPEIMEIKISFENLTIIFSLANEENIIKIHDLSKSVITQLTKKPLSDFSIQYVTLPLCKEGDSWYKKNIWDREQISNRFWGIGLNDANYVTNVYDSQKNEIITNACLGFGKDRY